MSDGFTTALPEVPVADPKSRDTKQPGGQDESDSIQYPTNHVLGVLDTSSQVECALDGLSQRGFLESEIELNRGTEFADRLGATSGRRGLGDWFIRIFERVGLKNAESELKEQYEEAVRNGAAVIAVLTPTEERKDLAVQLIRECGGRFINYFGRLNVERIGR
jgi:hypothetical protein